jgi:hypothetical protein
MAGEDVVVTTGLDLAGLQRDFRRGIGLADQFVSDLQRTLTSRDLIGDLTPAGRKAGASLARGLGDSLTGVGVSLARSLDLATPIIQQGATAGQGFTEALGVSIRSADEVLNRIAGAVDLSAGGERAGTQFTQGIARVISAEAPALRSAMAAAIVPATVATDIGRLETTITAALTRLPVVFGAAGVSSGAALVTGIAGELTGARAILTGFSTETSRAITAALTIGDVSGTGERAGRLLAVSVASGITAEAPRVRGALSTALVPSTLAPEVSRITGVFAAAGEEIVGLLGTAGTRGGQALTTNLLAEIGRGAAALRQLSSGTQIGVAIDSGPIRVVVAEQQKLLSATTQTTAAMRDLDAGIDAIDAKGITQATNATRTLADAQREWLREAERGSVAAQALWQRQREAAFQAGQQATRNATQAQRDAQAEVAARAQVRAELEHDITALGQYGGQVDATSRRARQAWLAEANAIKQQARDVGVSAAEMKRLDGIIDQVTQSFREQERAAQAAAAQIRNAGQSGARFGGNVVDLRGFQRQADVAKNAIGGITVAGRSLQQITGRLGPALVGVGFGLESLARGGTSADAGLRTALRAVASFAVFFGPEGFLVAGAAAATAAIIDLFATSRDEIKKTEKAFQDSIDEMVKGADTIGLQKQLRDIQLGSPKRLEDGTVEFRGGLVQLRRDLAAAEEAQRKAFRFGGGSIFKTTQEVDRLTGEVAKQEKVYQSLVSTILTLTTASREPALRQPFNIVGKSDAKLAEDALKSLKDQVDRLAETYQQLAPKVQLQEPIVARLTDKHEQINTLLAAQKDLASETAVAYRNMLKQLESIDAVLIETTRRKLPGGVAPTIEPPKITAVIDTFKIPAQTKITLPAEFDARNLNDSLRGAINSLSTAQTQQTFAKIFGSRQQVAQATKVVDTETKNLTRTFRAAIDAEVALAASGKLNVDRINQIIAAAQALNIDLTNTGRAAVSLSTTLSDVGSAAFAIADVAAAVKGMRTEISDAIANVGHLANALSDLSNLKLTGPGGIFSSFDNFLKGLPVIGNALSSAINAYRSVFGILTGKSTADENARILKSNTEAIVRLGQNLVGFNESITLFRESRAISGSAILAARAGTSGFGRGFRNVEELDEELRKSGVSLSELKRRADEYGITLVDAKGRISALGLKDLNAAIEITIRELTTFKDTLADQSFLASARRDIFDNDDVNAISTDWLDQFKRFAPDVFSKFFAGADITTKEGRDKFEAGIRNAFDLASKNLIPSEVLLQFGGAKGFIDFLLDADHALDGLTDTAESLNSEMINTVQGMRDFNLDRAVFRAQGPSLSSLASPAATSVYAADTGCCPGCRRLELLPNSRSTGRREQGHTHAFE